MVSILRPVLVASAAAGVHDELAHGQTKINSGKIVLFLSSYILFLLSSSALGNSREGKYV